MGMSENRAQRAVLERLFALQDTKYRAFQSKLMPTVAPETVIGVRTPLLRNLAKELAGTAEAADFLRVLPHEYYARGNRTVPAVHRQLGDLRLLFAQGFREA